MQLLNYIIKTHSTVYHIYRCLCEGDRAICCPSMHIKNIQQMSKTLENDDVHMYTCITGNFSNPLIINTGSLHATDTNTVYIASTISLATALIVSIVVSITTIVIILRSKAKIKAALNLQVTNQTGDRHTNGING